MILEQALAKHEPIVHRRYYEHVCAVARQAKCFVFDKEASRLIGQFAGECASLILQHRQFAKPPYDIMYIEYDGEAMHEGITHRDPVGWEDTRVGYIIYGRQVYAVAGANKRTGTPPILWPMFYYMGDKGDTSVPKSTYPVMNYGKGDDAVVNKISLMAGVGFDFDLRGKNKEEALENVNDRVSSMMSDIYHSTEAYWAGVAPLTENGAKGVILESIGDLKKVWAGLLWLNSVPKSVSFSAVPCGMRLYKGKRMALSAHNTVHIHLKGAQSVQHAYVKASQHRESPRLHDVRGHWRHKHGQRAGCSHQWPDMPDQHEHYVCTKCGRTRWWVTPFKRGDASKGFIEKDYTAEI